MPLKLFALMVLTSTAIASPYIEFGITVFDDYKSQPEVSWQSPTGTIELGWQFKDSWSAGITHESSIPQQEQGSGINGVFIRKRLWFKEDN